MQNSNNKFIERCKKILGLANIKTTEDDGWDCIEKFAVDWRKKYIGKPLAVCLPSSLVEVQKIVQLTKESNFTIVPQGGNTGLAGGATPDLSKKQIILSLRNLKKIRQIDFDNKTITLEAGCTLDFLQKKANELGLFFPLDFASRKEATVGGFLSTNAGGLSVLKYGNARSMCLGIEVVTPNGEVWTRLQGLRKDNSGYDLKDLFIGSEGTLGIITAATLSLTIKPNRKICALLVAENLTKTINFFSDIQKKFNDQLSAFEFMTQDSINLLKRYFPDALPSGLEKYNKDIFILVEISKFHTTNNIESFCDAMDFHDYVQTSINNNLLLDGVVSGSDNRTKQIWSVRSLIPYASAEDGPQVKNDISLPISSIPKFINNVSKKIRNFSWNKNDKFWTSR